MTEKIICAGFGGQGIMILGRLIATAGMNKGMNITWMPSYGAEVRGGTAHSMVVVSDEEIASPKIEPPTVAIIMNNPSFDKFKHKIAPGGYLLINSTLIKYEADLEKNVFKIPATKIAADLGNIRVANMVMAGALASKTDIFKAEDFIDCLKQIIPSHHHDLIPINRKAIKEGVGLVYKMIR